MADNFLALLESEAPNIKAMLPSYIGPDRWWAMAVEVSKSKDLQRIAQNNPASLIAALKKLADWGLELDGEEALIIPYGDEAQPQAMYKGLIRRAIEAGVAAHIYADIVREGEEVVIMSGSHRELKHTPNPFGSKGKKVIGGYAVAVLANGLTDFEIFNEDDIAAVKNAALRMAQRRDKNAGLSPAWKFFESEMIKKSAIRRLCKRLRGKRDTEMGNRYEKLLATEQTYETTAEELPDDLPIAKQEVSPMPQIEPTMTAEKAKAHAGKLALTPEVMPKKTEGPRKLNRQEQDEMTEQAKSMGLKLSSIVTIVYETCGVEDLCDVTTEQTGALAKAFQDAADAKALDDGAHLQAGR